MDAKTARKIAKKNKEGKDRERLKMERKEDKEIINKSNISYILEKIFKEIQEVAEGVHECKKAYYALVNLKGSWNRGYVEEQEKLGIYLAKLLKRKGFKATCKTDFTTSREFEDGSTPDRLRIYIEITW